MNPAISDLALDLGEAFLEAEYEGRTLVPEVQTSDLPETRAVLPRRDSVPPRLSFYARNKNNERRHPEVRVRKRKMPWIRV